jgi:DNA-directed RNA polymerase alpha subunit
MGRPVQPDTMPLQSLEISVRTLHACTRAGLLTVGDLRREGPQGVLRCTSIGQKALRELEAAIGTWSARGDPPAEQAVVAAIPTADLVAELARRFPVGG